MSTNWSGLFGTGTAYSAVIGAWTVPAVQASTALEVTSTWVGIGGVGTTRLIQTGTTEATVDGSTYYSAWYELLPAPSIPLEEPVSPGDEMEAGITETAAHTWSIAIEDLTRGWTAGGTFTYTAGTAASVDWITERPESGGRFLPLADYGSTHFHDVRFTGTGTTATSFTDAFMVEATSSDRVVSYPGVRTSTTTGSFTDHYGAPLPTVTSVSPASGSTAGATKVTITGTYLVPGLVVSVHFGTAAASDVVDSGGTIAAASPAGSGTVNVTVTTTDGTSPATEADQFVYLSPATPPPPTPPPPAETGYDLVGSDGGVFVFDAPGQSGGYYGSLPSLHVVPAKPIVGMVPTVDDQGYLLVGGDGGVFSFGDAPFLGSLPGVGVTPAQPITGIVAAATDHGYFLVGRDGGVFAFGTVPYLGSLPGDHVAVDNIIGIAATPSGNGYWLVSSTGSVYGFGAARHLGTARGTSSPVAAIAGTPTGGGYWIATQDGTVYPFGIARSFGTLPALDVTPTLPVIGIVHTAGTGGYWMIGQDGGVFAFGDAPYVGSLPGLQVHVGDVVGAVPT